MSETSELILSKAKSLGVAAASCLFPRDFECYMVALELCDGETGKSLDYFTFPIMPNDLNIQDTPIVNVQNTFGGVSVLSSNLFNPKKISLNGNFGRKIKLLNRGFHNSNFTGFFTSNEVERNYGNDGDSEALKTLELSSFIKTGYGCTKVLQSILNRSYGINKKTGRVNKLYFYNMAFGESYLVKFESFTVKQSLGNNMMWDYDLALTAISPLNLGLKSRAKVFAISAVQQVTNSLVQGLVTNKLGI